MGIDETGNLKDIADASGVGGGGGILGGDVLDNESAVLAAVGGVLGDIDVVVDYLSLAWLNVAFGLIDGDPVEDAGIGSDRRKVDKIIFVDDAVGEDVDFVMEFGGGRTGIDNLEL